MNTSLLHYLEALKTYNRKAFAVLIDPDKSSEKAIFDLVEKAGQLGVDLLLVGGSLMANSDIHELVPLIKARTEIPVVLFPASVHQIVPSADGILFLSLISGRNPEYLIGQHVMAAPLLKQTSLEILATGYMLIDSGKVTTAHYMSNTPPIPYDKSQIALSTAMAGEMLGLRLIYMDGGSGAEKTISLEMIQQVANNISLPLIVGGGIRTATQAENIWNAGADMIVIGNAIEKDPGYSLIQEVADVKVLRNKAFL